MQVMAILHTGLFHDKLLYLLSVYPHWYSIQRQPETVMKQSPGRDKLFHPVSVDGSAIAWTAGVGVVINALTAWLFMKDKDKDLNVKGAYLHMAADTLVSVGVVASGIIITYTGWSIIDPIIGLGIAVIIIVSTWGLLHDSLRLSLE